MKVQFLPHYAGPRTFEPAHEGDAGIDLYAAEDHVLYPGERHLIRCGIRVALPLGTEGQVRPKSGLAWNFGLSIVNSPGTIDEGYRGEIQVIAHNTNPLLTQQNLWHIVAGSDSPVAPDPYLTVSTDIKNRTIFIKKGTKIAQLVIAKYERPAVEIVTDLDDETSRGAGGFGSTGT